MVEDFFADDVLVEGRKKSSLVRDLLPARARGLLRCHLIPAANLNVCPRPHLSPCRSSRDFRRRVVVIAVTGVVVVVVGVTGTAATRIDIPIAEREVIEGCVEASGGATSL